MSAQTVLVGLGPGVSGHVAALLLRSQGLEVHAAEVAWTGFEPGERSRRWCEREGIPYSRIDASGRFEAFVLDPLLHGALVGAPPDARALFLRDVLWGALFAEADRLGGLRVATGHLAEIQEDGARRVVLEALDLERDQSRELAWTGSGRVERLLLPLGTFSDVMMMRLASEAGIEPLFAATDARRGTARLPGLPADWSAWVRGRVAPDLRPGGIVKTLDGQILGEHSGIWQYRIGTSRGLDTLGPRAEGKVAVSVDAASALLRVSAPATLNAASMVAAEASWLSVPRALAAIRCRARIDGDTAGVECRLLPGAGGTLRVEFEGPPRKVVPGATVLFYVGRELLGGAFVRAAADPL